MESVRMPATGRLPYGLIPLDSLGLGFELSIFCLFRPYERVARALSRVYHLPGQRQEAGYGQGRGHPLWS